jgi:putative ABC transport system substrate-binding protein
MIRNTPMKGPLPILHVLIALVLLFSPGAAEDPKLYRIGVLFWHDSPNDREAWTGIQDGFRLAGLRASFDEAWVEEDTERADERITAWEAAGYDLVYAMGTKAALRAREATRRIPVVFTAVTNPVGTNVVPSWDGSGTNLCGNSNWIGAADVLRAFRTCVPSLARLGVVYTVRNPVPVEEIADAKRHFRREPSQEIKLIEEWVEDSDALDAGDTSELDGAVRSVLDRGAQALWVPIDDRIYKRLDRIAEQTVPRGIPIVSSQASTVRTHAVVAVAVDYRALGRNSVVLAEKVLRRGADPGTLPIGRMNAYRVLVNLDAARRTGFEVPLTILATADGILEEEPR